MDRKKNIYMISAAIVALLVLIGITKAAICLREPDSENEVKTSAEKSTRTKEVQLPEKYDVRSIGKDPVIKSQGHRGTCWALTSTSALEAAFLPDQRIVFSADHMSLNNGFVITQKEGGDYKMIMAYLSGWYGPVLEEDDPYGDDRTTEGAETAAHVQDIRLLEGEPLSVFKEMIYTSGPVQTSLYMDRKTTSASQDYYNEETCGFYYPEEMTPTHDVLILGWDDTFPAQSFKIKPDRDGAFICQNTWGSSFGDEGIFYVSYADPNIAKSGLAYLRVDPADSYDHIYQTDECGWQGRQGYDKPQCFFANVFTASSKQQLSAAGFYSIGSYSDYEIYAVHDFSSEKSLKKRKLLSRGSVEGQGFFTVDFPEPESVEEGERFAVVVKITTPGVDKPVAVEINKDEFTQNVTTEGKESYISLSGKNWENTQKEFETNVCLKVYSRDS